MRGASVLTHSLAERPPHKATTRAETAAIPPASRCLARQQRDVKLAVAVARDADEHENVFTHISKFWNGPDGPHLCVCACV